jgi:hypothetical protein
VAVSVEQGSLRTNVFAGEDGRFEIGGLQPGKARVKAFSDDRRSAEADVEVTDAETSHVDLLLDKSDARDLSVAVTSHGSSVPNAFLFLQGATQFYTATTGADGRATVKVRPDEAALTTAVYSSAEGWTFATLDTASDSTVELAPSRGSIEISASANRNITISTAGFMFERALSILGVTTTVAPGRPLRINRLPAGRYAIVTNGAAKTIDLRDEERTARVDFP